MAAVCAGAEPLYSTREGLAEDGVGEGLWMNVLFRETHTGMIYRHWGCVKGDKSDCLDQRPMCLLMVAQVMGQVPCQTGSHRPASVAVYGGTQGVFCLPQVSLGRFQVSMCRSRAGLQPLLKPRWRSRLQAGGVHPSQCKGAGGGI